MADEDIPEPSQTPIEQAAPAPEASIPTAVESTAPIEPTQVPSEPIAAAPPEPVESASPPSEPSAPPQEPEPALTAPVSSPILTSPPSITESPRPPVVSQVEPSPKSFYGERSRTILKKALAAIQFRKKAKLEKIMKLAQEKRSITNDQVQKLLRVSDATATRYLSELVRQSHLRRLGDRGSARYEPIIGSIPAV